MHVLGRLRLGYVFAAILASVIISSCQGDSTPEPSVSVPTASSTIQLGDLSPTQAARCGRLVWWGHTMQYVGHAILFAPNDTDRLQRMEKYTQQNWSFPNDITIGVIGPFIDPSVLGSPKGTFTLQDEYWLPFKKNGILVDGLGTPIPDTLRKELEWNLYQTDLALEQMFLLGSSIAGNWNGSIDGFITQYRTAANSYQEMGLSLARAGVCAGDQDFVELWNYFRNTLTGF